MKYRPLGTTGMLVSQVGLGGWQLTNPSWGMHDAGEATRIVEAAADAGCNFFDTAPGYASGRSEELLGRALKPLRSKVLLCSKFGHSPEGVTNFGVEALRPSIEASLKRLQTDYLDVLLVHNPPADVLDGNSTSLYEELQRLKAGGLLRSYGVSVDSSADLEKVMATTQCGVVEILFNVFHQEPRRAFAAAKHRGIGLIAKVPLDSGWLSGKYRADTRFIGVRNRWSPEVIARRTELVDKLKALLPPNLSLSHAALGYILAQSEISTVIPGAKTVQQLHDNLSAAEAELSSATTQLMQAFWEQELEAAPLPW